MKQISLTVTVRLNISVTVHYRIVLMLQRHNYIFTSTLVYDYLYYLLNTYNSHVLI